MHTLKTHQIVAFSLAAAGMALASAMTASAAQDGTATTPAQPHVVLEIQGLHYDAGGQVLVRATARNDGKDEVENPLTDPIADGFRLSGPDGKSWQPVATGKPSPQNRPKRMAALTYFGQVIDLTVHFPVLAKVGRYEMTYASGDQSDTAVTINVIEVYNPDASYKAVIKTAKGDLTLQLFREDAPLAVRNFVDLARQGFYDGLAFHYIRPGDIVIGGDPAGDGTGGSGFFIPAEFNRHQHLNGTVAMVRGAEPDTASSQFYICLKPQPERDGKFTVFAQVVEGMDTLTSLAATPTSGADSKPYFRPLEPMVMETITILETAPEEDEDS